METIEILPNGYRFYQDDALFKLGTDSTMLANFATVRKRDRICDLCCGCGSVMMQIAGRRDDTTLVGVELQQEPYEFICKNITANSLTDRAQAVLGDIKNIRELLPASVYDLVTANPPYRRVNSGLVCENNAIEIARSEIMCTIEDVCAAASYLLRSGGRFALVHRPDRLTDVMCAMRENKIEPKRLKTVFAPSGTPSLVLVEGIRDGKSGINIEK